MSNNWHNISVAKAGNKIENDYDGEFWTKLDNEHEAAKTAAAAVPENNLRIGFDSAVKVEEQYDGGGTFYLATYYGGLNGGGPEDKWAKYLEAIKTIMSNFKHSWLVELWNDCCDDVWYLTIGFRI